MRIASSAVATADAARVHTLPASPAPPKKRMRPATPTTARRGAIAIGSGASLPSESPMWDDDCVRRPRRRWLSDW